MLSILVSSSTKSITTPILVIAKLNSGKDFVLRGCVYDLIFLSKWLPAES